MNAQLQMLEKKIQTQYCSDKFVNNKLDEIQKVNPEELTGELPESVVQNHQWNRKYLNELHGRFVCGARSRDAITHMAKVSRFVYLREMCIRIALVTAAVVSICCIIAAFFRR